MLEGWELVALQGAFEMCGECELEVDGDGRTGLRCASADSDRWRPKQTLLRLFAFFRLNDTKVHVARGGYTGEDGFEIRPVVSIVYKSHAALQDSFPPRKPS